MPWFLGSLEWQQPWYWKCRIDRFLSSQRETIRYICHLSADNWCKFIFMFPQTNSARHGLKKEIIALPGIGVVHRPEKAIDDGFMKSNNDVHRKWKYMILRLPKSYLISKIKVQHLWNKIRYAFIYIMCVGDVVNLIIIWNYDCEKELQKPFH